MTQGLSLNSDLQTVYRSFQKKSELLFALVIDPESPTSKEKGVAIRVLEPSLQNDYKDMKYVISADSSEIICINDIIREVSGGDGSGSGYSRGMRSWHNSFKNYIEKLQALVMKLESGKPMSNEELRLAKEIAINYPSGFAEDNSKSLEEKFITTNMTNLLTSVFKFSRISDSLISEQKK